MDPQTRCSRWNVGIQQAVMKQSHTTLYTHRLRLRLDWIGFGSWELYVGLYILKDLINSSHILLNNWWWWLMKDPVADAMCDKHRLKLIS